MACRGTVLVADGARTADRDQRQAGQSGRRYKDDDAKRLVDREFNLSYTTELPDDNRVVAGTGSADATTPQMSIEQGSPRLINVKLGDTLRFDVTGLADRRAGHERAQARLGFVQGQLLRADAARRAAGLARRRSSRASICRRSKQSIDRRPDRRLSEPHRHRHRRRFSRRCSACSQQVIGAVQFLFAFTLAAGVLVLYAALAGTRDERMRESRAAARAGRVASAGAGGADRRVRRGGRAGGSDGGGRRAGDRLRAGDARVRVPSEFQSRGCCRRASPPASRVRGVGGWLSLRHVLARPALQSLRGRVTFLSVQ